MEKSNFINLIVSILLSVAGVGFILYGLFIGSDQKVDMVLIIVGVLLIAYGAIRFLLTNKAAKELS